MYPAFMISYPEIIIGLFKKTINLRFCPGYVIQPLWITFLFTEAKIPTLEGHSLLQQKVYRSRETLLFILGLSMS